MKSVQKFPSIYKALFGLLFVLLINKNITAQNSTDSKFNSHDTILPTINSEAPMMGWASWNNFRIHINEDIIKSQANAMISTGLKAAGYAYINIDDGFFGVEIKTVIYYLIKNDSHMA